MENFNTKGSYLDGVKKIRYYFTGKLKFDEESFVGLVNDGRCPAEILDGRVHNGFWRFLKKYRNDGNIVEHPFFEKSQFSEPNLGDDVCDDWQGIVYYGRTVGSEKTSNTATSVWGVYNSLVFKDGYDEQERRVKSFVHAGKEDIDRLIERIKEGAVDSVGPWRMDISHPNGVPRQFAHIPSVDMVHTLRARIPVKLRESAFFDY